jgi:hypothetical protein
VGSVRFPTLDFASELEFLWETAWAACRCNAPGLLPDTAARPVTESFSSPFKAGRVFADWVGSEACGARLLSPARDVRSSTVNAEPHLAHLATLPSAPLETRYFELHVVQ